MQNKPTSVYQTYELTIDRLVVHESADPTSPVVFEGKAEDYDGFATYPKAPTFDYLHKIGRVDDKEWQEYLNIRIKTLEDEGLDASHLKH